MTKEDVYSKYLNAWVAESGLGRLGINDSDILESGIESVRNDNGILFLNSFLVCAKIAGIDIYKLRDRIKDVIKTLQVSGKAGLYSRQPYAPYKAKKYEQHDNYMAICSLSVLLNLNYAHDIIKYGQMNLWNFNNINPDVWKTKCQRQGGEIAFYELCAYGRASPWTFVWLFFGLLINCFRHNSSLDQLTWIRLYTLSQIKIKSGAQDLGIHLIKILWLWRKKAKYGSLLGMLKTYYKKEHPIKEMAAFLEDGDFGFYV